LVTAFRLRAAIRPTACALRASPLQRGRRRIFLAGPSRTPTTVPRASRSQYARQPSTRRRRLPHLLIAAACTA
jgi:hypothetical protein